MKSANFIVEYIQLPHGSRLSSILLWPVVVNGLVRDLSSNLYGYQLTRVHLATSTGLILGEDQDFLGGQEVSKSRLRYANP
jgi:hypothetical protein